MLRGSETDVINIYNHLRPVVELANGGYILNRGYWTNDTKDPIQAQYQLCKIIGEFGSFSSAKTLLDIGSGLCKPAINWKSMYSLLNIICVDLNFNQLRTSMTNEKNFYTGIPSAKVDNNSLKHSSRISNVNASARLLPFASHSIDSIIALESHQHFRPLNFFIQETKRVLTNDGSLVIASPVKISSSSLLSEMSELGILSLALKSKNFEMEYIKLLLSQEGFHLDELKHVGLNIYEPAERYFTQNRATLKLMISNRRYPRYVENALHNLLIKSKEAYRRGLLDYVLIKCTPQ
jgi:SAM-dependent methyltransferase